MKKFVYIGLVIAAGLVAGCKNPQPSTATSQTVVNIQFLADSAFAYCQAQCDFGPRIMNSEAHERCAQWIQQKFEQFGCNVEMQRADLLGYDGTTLRSTNIIAHSMVSPLGGTEGGTPTILICAHWDSRPWADNDPDPSNHHTPVMAANDGASGVGVMLELARLIQQYGDSLNVNVDFVCFDAEDWGIPQWSSAPDNGRSWALGSQYWAAQYAQAKAATLNAPLGSAALQGKEPSTLNAPPYRYGVLLDMVGGQGARFYKESMSLKYARSIVDKVWTAASVAGYGSMFPNDEGVGITDDHIPVNQVAGVPCIDIIPYYPDCPQSSFGPTWHTVSDDMQHLDRASLQAVGQTLVQLLFSE